MIRTEKGYRDAQERLRKDREILDEQRRALTEMGLSGAEVERAIQPALSFQAQLQDEVDMYERVVRGDISPIENLAQVGRILTSLRVASGITQRELAERLGVNESVISRDERNEYSGISVDRAQRILECLGGSVTVIAEASRDRRESLSMAR